MRKSILIFLLIFVSCQKDYYLDDLNDALSQISSLQIENQNLKQQLQQINNQKQQLEQQISNLNNQNSSLQSQLTALNNSYSNLDSAYNQLAESQQISLNEIEDLKAQIIELANQLRIQISKENPIENGYYYTRGYSRVVNDSLEWNIDIEKNIPIWLNAGVVRVDNGEIIEDYTISKASNYWVNANENDILKHRTYWARNYTYKSKFGEYMYINEYTGDSVPYIDNYKVYDKDIFTWDLVFPITEKRTKRLVNKNVSYKLFTSNHEIIEGVSYPPVVDISNNSNFEGINSFEEIKEVYDYESNLGFLSESIYSAIEQNNPKSYLSAFIKDAQRNGIDLSHVNPDELITEPWYTPTDQYGRGSITAWGSITCSETINRIGYNNSWFEGSFLTDKKWYKLYVMYHEFGHTVLGLKHTCAKNHIMTSGNTGDYPCNGEEIDEYDYIDTVDEFKRAVTDMFNGYNQFYYDCYLSTEKENIRPE